MPAYTYPSAMRRSSSPSSDYTMRVLLDNAERLHEERKAKQLEEDKKKLFEQIKKQQSEAKRSSILQFLDVAALGRGKYYKAAKTRRMGFRKKSSRGKRNTRHRRRH